MVGPKKGARRLSPAILDLLAQMRPREGPGLKQEWEELTDPPRVKREITNKKGDERERPKAEYDSQRHKLCSRIREIVDAQALRTDAMEAKRRAAEQAKDADIVAKAVGMRQDGRGRGGKGRARGGAVAGGERGRGAGD